MTIVLSLISYYCIETLLRKKLNILFWIFLVILLSINIVCYIFIRDKNNTPRSIPEKYTQATFGVSHFDASFKSVGVIGDSIGSPNCPKIFLVGDSHALTMSYYFDLLGKKYNLPIHVISNSTYAPIDGLNRSFSNRRCF